VPLETEVAGVLFAIMTATSVLLWIFNVVVEKQRFHAIDYVENGVY
jgi:hypothetical protein